MKIGDVVEVANIGSDEWVPGKVMGFGKDNTVIVDVDAPESELHHGDDPKKPIDMTVDRDHLRVPDKK